MAPHLETEVKLPVGDLKDALGRPAAIGARLVYPREFEDNLIFDFPDWALARRGALARVRVTDRAVTLTYKGPVSLEGQSTAGGELKSRLEAEASLNPSEGEALLSIVQGLGMKQVWRYQKYRTTWALGQVEIMLDETPIGAWFELEGDPTAIDAAASALGYRRSEYLASTYRDLYLQHLQRLDQGSRASHPEDRMIFAS